MRKDVKLGFAIGGVLLAVLIVYVLVVPGSDKPAPTQSSAIPTETVVEPTGTQPQTLTTPSTAPVAVDAPNGTERDVFAKPTDGSTQAQNTPKREPKWDQLLDGELPLTQAVTGVSPIGNGQAITATDIAKTSVPAEPPTTQSLDQQALIQTKRTAPEGSHTHTIREGETLSSISAAAYGTANRYTDIIKANPGLNPSKLKIGQTINIPAASSSPSDGIASAVSGEKVSINSTTEYKVAPGDSLYKISVKLYGKGELSTKIYELNKSSIGNDPAKLKVGSVLKLPQAPTIAAR